MTVESSEMALHDADLMGVGSHCTHPECNQLDFLPFKCSGCSQVFCGEHRSCSSHNCSSPNVEDSSVIICPLCAKAIRLPPNEDPNVTYDRHTQSKDCDPSNYDKVHRKKKCPVKGCKEKLTSVNTYKCKECQHIVCLKHRLPVDHICAGPPPPTRKQSSLSSLKSTFTSFIMGNATPTIRSAKKSSEKTPLKPHPLSTTHTNTAASKARNAAKRVTESFQSQILQYRSGYQQQREICPQCGKSFATVQKLIDHAAQVHSDGWQSGAAIAMRPETGSSIERCPQCNAEFQDAVSLVKHVETKHPGLKSTEAGTTGKENCIVS